MTNLTSDPPVSLVEPAGIAALALRILQPGLPEHEVKLAPGKCTVGSSQRCQVHLSAASIRPLHCLIVHGSDETIVTRWAPGVLLNGQEFATAPLAVGDCLSLGDTQIVVTAAHDETDSQDEAQSPVELEAAQEQETEAAPTPVLEVIEDAPVSQTSEIHTIQEEHAEVSETTASNFEIKHLQEASRTSRSRCRKLVGALRGLRGQVAGFELQIAELKQQHETVSHERGRIADELQRFQLEVTEKNQQSSEEMDRLIAELTEAFEKAEQAESKTAEQTALVEQLQIDIAAVQQQRDQLAQAREAGDLQRAKLAQALADRDRALESLQAEVVQLQAVQEDAAEQLASATSRSEQLEFELERLQAERDELVSTRSTYQLREQEWEQAIADREQKLQAFDDEREQLQQTIEEEKRRFAAYMEESEQREAEFSNLQSERDELLTAKSEFESCQSDWEKTLSERDRTLAAKEEECQSLNAVLQNFEQGAFEDTEARNRLETELAELRREADELRTSRSQQEEQFSELKQQLEQSERVADVLKSELEETLQMRELLEAETAQRAKTCQSQEAELEQLRSRCEQLSVEQLSTAEQKEQLEQAFTEYQLTIDQLTKQLTAADKKRQELEQTLALGTETNDQLHGELEGLQQRCEALAKQRADESELRQEVQQQLVEGQQHSELFEVDLKSLRAELSSANEKTVLLEEKLAEAEQQVTTLHAELEAHTQVDPEADVSANSTELARWEEEKSSLVQRIEEQASHAEQLAAELERLESQHRQDQENLAAAREELKLAAEALQTLAAEQSQMAEESPAAEEYTAAEESPVAEQNLVAESASTELELPAELEAPVEEAFQPAEEPEVASEDQFEQPEPIAAESPAEPSELKEDFFSAPAEVEEPAEEFQPASFIDQFSQMVDEDNSLGIEQPVAVPVEPVVESVPQVSSLEEDSEDVALEAYMANMMSRMRGDSSGNTPAPLPHAEAIKQDPNPLEAVDEVAQRVSQTTEEVPFEPLDLESLKNSSRKPALPTDLTAMRELANSSARKAIAKHHKRRHLEKAVGLFLVCLIALGVGIYLMLAAKFQLNAQFFGGAFATVIGAIGGVKLLGLLLSAIRDGSWQQATPAEISVEAESLPIDGVDDAADEA